MVDDFDRRLLELLARDGRRPFASLAKELGVSLTTVRARLAKLQEDDVVTTQLSTDAGERCPAVSPEHIDDVAIDIIDQLGLRFMADVHVVSLLSVRRSGDAADPEALHSDAATALRLFDVTHGQLRLNAAYSCRRPFCGRTSKTRLVFRDPENLNWTRAAAGRAGGCETEPTSSATRLSHRMLECSPDALRS